ncbi:MAG: hypothetical protein ACTSUN_07590 [Promethearchaeota archaeon]
MYRRNSGDPEAMFRIRRNAGSRVRGLRNVFKDTYLKFIAFFFMIIVAHETGIEDMYLKPTCFFG